MVGIIYTSRESVTRLRMDPLTRVIRLGAKKASKMRQLYLWRCESEQDIYEMIKIVALNRVKMRSLWIDHRTCEFIPVKPNLSRM